MTVKPSYRDQEEFQNRLRKLGEIQESGVEPYPHKFTPTHSAQQLEAQYANQPVGDSEAAAAAQTERVVLAGRLMLFRAMGKNAFGHIQDETGRLQVMFNREC